MKKWKKSLISGLLAIATIFASAVGCDIGNGDSSSSDSSSDSSSTTTNATESNKPTGSNIFSDENYENGFHIYGTGINGSTRDLKKTITFKEGARPVWSVAQWFSQHHLDQGAVTDTANLFKIQDESKTFQLNKKTGAITMAMDASKEFTGVQTPTSVSAFWPHLLLEQANEPIKMKDCNSMRAYLKFRIDRANDCSGQFGSVAIQMQAQFAWFIYVKNVNPASPGYNEFLWLGFNIYNPKALYAPTVSQQDYAGGTPGDYIYSLGAAKWNDNKRVKVGETVELNADMFATVQEGLDKAHAAGFMTGSTIDDVAITGMNIGFEVFDVWDMQTTIFDLGVYYT